MAFYYRAMSKFLWPLSVSCLATIFLISPSDATNNGGITVDLIRRDSPLSPLYDPSKTRYERLRSSFNRSLSRLHSLKLAPASNQFESPLAPSHGEYLMKIRVGTPPVEALAIADTGSDLTWIQCTPCTDCYEQNAPLFDPAKSDSYRNVSCSSKQCRDAGSFCGAEPDSSVCEYLVSYGDNSVTKGDVALETFVFDSSSGQNASFPEVAFGCGHQDYGTFFSGTSGIVGLGGGAVSIIRQLQNSIDGRFSYCLTSPDSNVSSKINFGSKAVVTGPDVASTPLATGYYDTFYYVTLEGFTVGNKKLDVSKKSSDSDTKVIEEANMFLDTGTTFTFLQRSFYDELEAMLVKAVNGSRVSDPRGVTGLCYRRPSDGELQFPPVTAHFRGAELELEGGGVFVEAEEGVVCLSLVPSDSEVMVFGNLNQMNYLVGFDLVNREVNFLPTDCSKNQP